MDFKERTRTERILIFLKSMQPQACLSKLWKGPPKCLTTHLTRLEPQRDAMCSIIFHNINTVGPWRDCVFYRCAQGRPLPWLGASSQHLIGNGARSCTEGQGAVLPGQVQGRHSWGPGVCVWGKAEGTHSWGACGGGQTEGKPISGKSSHCGKWGNATVHSKCSTSVKFHWIQCSEKTTHFHPKTISGNIVRGVTLHLASTTVCLREKKILAHENHHSDNVIPLYEEKRYQGVGITGLGFKLSSPYPEMDTGLVFLE